MLYILSKKSNMRKPYTVHEAYAMKKSLRLSKVVSPTT